MHEDSNYNPGPKVVLATASVLLIHPSSDKGYDLFQRLVKGFRNRSLREGEVGGHSESLRPSDMGSVQNLIGMPSNGYVPKVAV